MTKKMTMAVLTCTNYSTTAQDCTQPQGASLSGSAASAWRGLHFQLNGSFLLKESCSGFGAYIIILASRFPGLFLLNDLNNETELLLVLLHVFQIHYADT